MKTILISLITLFTTISFGLNYSYDSHISDQIDDLFANFKECNGAEFSPFDTQEFKLMHEKLKDDEEQSKIEIIDLDKLGYTLLDKTTNKECQLILDLYDGRCYYTTCN